jgi:hypothetical protein
MKYGTLMRLLKYDPVTKNGGIFTEYVNTFLKIKQEASSWPEWCKTKEDQQMYINNYYEKRGNLANCRTHQKESRTETTSEAYFE